jgi:prevent-host-death family protein
MTRHIPISDFKDHASEIVAAAERGEEIVITRHGKAAARLSSIAAGDEVRRQRVEAALASLAETRARMRADGRTVTMEEIIAWKNEGRR